jgi:hypothetical protein
MEDKPSPSNMREEEWALVTTSLTLMSEAAPQREYLLGRGLQRLALGCAHGGAVTLAAARPAAVARRLSADAALARGPGLQCAGIRPALGVARRRWSEGATDVSGLRQPHLAGDA